MKPTQNRQIWLAFLACLTWAGSSSSAHPFEFMVPQSAAIIDQETRSGSIRLPQARYGLISKPGHTVSGQIERRAWRVDGSDASGSLSAQLIAQYERQGFQLEWQCSTQDCGGFDFRYNIETSPPPEFQVNLEEFHYADLRKGEEAIIILSSALDNKIFIQQIFVDAYADTEAFDLKSTATSAQTQTDAHSARWILESVQFDPGQSEPSNFDEGELQTIADQLKANPDQKVYIVGHSDQSGSLSANITITRARAEAVRQILIAQFDLTPSRIFADGVGFLAPIADNATDDGRARNRRVEAVFLVN